MATGWLARGQQTYCGYPDKWMIHVPGRIKEHVTRLHTLFITRYNSKFMNHWPPMSENPEVNPMDKDRLLCFTVIFILIKSESLQVEIVFAETQGYC